MQGRASLLNRLENAILAIDFAIHAAEQDDTIRYKPYAKDQLQKAKHNLVILRNYVRYERTR
jgi:predicted nucleotide-binding protein